MVAFKVQFSTINGRMPYPIMLDEKGKALKTAKKYLEKVDSYREGVADEAHYFWKVKINELLKGDAK